MDEGWEPLNIGEAEILEEGEDILIIAYGSMVASAIETAKILKNININACVVNARFVKPLDKNLIMPLASKIKKVITMEEGTRVPSSIVITFLILLAKGIIRFLSRGFTNLALTTHALMFIFFRIFAVSIADATIEP